jgi:hypothetical protein
MKSQGHVRFAHRTCHALLPAEWRDHLAERHHHIGIRLRERDADLALEQPTWTHDLGRLPSEPWRMFEWHHTAAEVDVVRTKYRIDPSEPQAIPDKLHGNPVADRLQERVTALHKAAALSTAPEAAESTQEHYAAQAAEQTAAARTALVSAAQAVQQATTTAVATATAVVAGTTTETTTDVAPALPVGTGTTPAAAASPRTGQEGTIMSDPLDETLEHVGRQAGRAGQGGPSPRRLPARRSERRTSVGGSCRRPSGRPSASGTSPPARPSARRTGSASRPNGTRSGRRRASRSGTTVRRRGTRTMSSAMATQPRRGHRVLPGRFTDLPEWRQKR